MNHVPSPYNMVGIGIGEGGPPNIGYWGGPPQYDPNVGVGPNIGVRVGSKGISLTK